MSPLHHCPIAWSISDRSFFASGVKVAKAVKSYEIESAVLAPRRISVVVTVQLGIVVINDHAFGPGARCVGPPAVLSAHGYGLSA